MVMTKLEIVRRAFRKVYARAFVAVDPIGFARSIGVTVGQDCRFFASGYQVFGSEPYLITIGDHVTITEGVRFITHDGGVWVFRAQYPDLEVFGPITVGNNVFVGVGSIILPNVKIGDNVIIGAGSLVTRDCPTNTVVAGVPARPLRSIDEYYRKVVAKATQVRSYPAEVKRKFLLARYRNEES